MKSFDLPADEAAILNAVLGGLPDEKPAPTARAMHASSIEWNLAGVCRGARIGTVFGDLPVEALRVRDEVRTSSGVIARVAKIDRIELDAEFLQRHPNALPIRIAPSAFGPGQPAQELLVSPQQDISGEAHIAGRFVKAVALQGRFGAMQVGRHGLTYYRFHCDEPVVIKVDGVWLRMMPW